MTPYLGPNPDAVIAELRSRDSDLFAHSELVAVHAANLLRLLHVHHGNVRELLAALLFQRIASGFEAILVLAERGMHTPGLLQRRSILEALFVLGAIWQQPKMAEEFLAADNQRVLHIYKNIKRLPPEVRAAIESELSDAAVDAKIAELKSKGPASKPPTVLDYAQAAGLITNYLTDYAVSSEAAHHVAKDLERHIALDADGDVNGIFWGPEKEPPAELLVSAVDYVLMATVAVEKLFTLEASKEGERLRKRTNQLIEKQASAAE